MDGLKRKMSYDPAKMAYIDGRLRGMCYTAAKVADLYDQLQTIQFELNTGLPKSPRIKSKEEAFYQQSQPVYHSVVIELANKEALVYYQYRRFADEINELGKFLSSLTPEEVQLLIWRYEYGKTYESLGRKYHMDKSVIRRKINAILAKF